MEVNVPEDNELQLRLLTLMSALRPASVKGTTKRRYGRDYDGGYVLLSDVEGYSLAYSLGICDDVSFDLVMAEFGAEVFQYDHTIDVVPQEHPRFHFNKMGIAVRDDLAPDLRRLDTIIRYNGHLGASGAVLKMDIEGNEWDVFDGIGPEVLGTFRQIVCEFHGMDNARNEDWLARAERAVTNLTRSHQVFHVHGNNNDSFSVIAGVVVPNVFELSLARRADYEFEASVETFPTPLDMPSTPARPDLVLGAFAYGSGK